MKKFTLLAAALLGALTSQAAATQLWLVGDPIGGWSPVKGVEMTAKGEGVFTGEFTFEKTCWFAFVDQLMTDGNDWTGFNAHRYGPEQNDLTPQPGVPAKMIYGQDRSFKLPAGTYTFTVNTETMEMTMGGEVVVTMGDLFLRGDINGWGTGDDYKFTKVSDDVYTYTIASLPQGSAFKIADADWGFSFTSDRTDMTPGQTYPVLNGYGQNMSFASAVENVTFTLNVKDQTLGIEGKSGELYVPETLYIVGNVNGVNWAPATAPELTKNGSVFTIEDVVLKNTDAPDDTNAYFSFITRRSESWDEVNAATRIGAPAHDQPISSDTPTAFSIQEPPFAGNANSWKIQEGTYNITIDFATGSVSVTEGSTSADITIEQTETPVYFSLQGIRVDNPERGIYIRVANGKARTVKL